MMNKNELNDFINGLRHKNPDYRTNLYQRIDLIEEKILCGNMKITTTADLLLLTEADDDLTRVYFCSRNETGLQTIIPSLSSKPEKTVLDRRDSRRLR